jgi:16S rRNA A1518/A1519 N6-dimethyltransferase RsmA/KsgA/DIM1 with predicted DNA glycosylase/AP lyase activity
MNNLVTIYSKRSREEISSALQTAGVPSDARAETLTLEQFLRVYNQLR